MLRTVEATLDPANGVHFIEPITIERPVRVLVTFMEKSEKRATAEAYASTSLDLWLDAAPECKPARSPEEMDRYIQELRTSWDA